VLTATVAYPLVSTMERFVPDHSGTITGRDFAADVTFTMEVPQSESDAFAAALTDTTSGRVTCRKAGTVVKPVVSGL
jgi:putative IMPACT (imprinted ancient) family translation regulator